MVSWTDIETVDAISDEFKFLEEYLIKSHGHTHHLSFKVQVCVSFCWCSTKIGSQVQDIFRIERNGEEERFNKSSYAKSRGSDRRLLWHGSRVTNYVGILSQGLRIAPPEAPVNGYAFGKGVYLVSHNSANHRSEIQRLREQSQGRYFLQISQLLPIAGLKQHRPSSPLRS